MARLIPIASDLEVPIEVRTPRHSFGREGEVDTRIDDAAVSRLHAVLEHRDQGFWLGDLGSRNGTLVNGRKLFAPRRLEDGDRITIGSFEARFEPGGPAARFRVQERKARREVVQSFATLGRDSRATVVVRDPGVSRIHATIRYRDGGFVLSDGESTNGTFVGEERVVERTLASGDEIRLGARPSGPPAARIGVSIEADACTLSVFAVAPGEVGSGAETTLPFGFDATLPMSRRLASAALEDRTRGPVVAPALRGKSKHTSARWVPSADLERRGLLRALVLTLSGVVLAGGLWAIAAERERIISPGALSAAHDSERFAERAGGRPACAACHDPWNGVDDAACTRCHQDRAELASRAHAQLGLGCASCHPEHRGLASIPDLVARHRCTDCHQQAHAPVASATASAKLFLDRSATAPRVHAGHRELACARCHASAADQESGRVSTPCSDCHGGRQGMADARCASCHRFHLAVGRGSAKADLEHQ